MKSIGPKHQRLRKKIELSLFVKHLLMMTAASLKSSGSGSSAPMVPTASAAALAA